MTTTTSATERSATAASEASAPTVVVAVQPSSSTWRVSAIARSEEPTTSSRGRDHVQTLDQDVDCSPTCQSGGGRIAGFDVERHDEVRRLGREQVPGCRDHLGLGNPGEECASRPAVGVDDQQVVARTRSQPVGADHPGNRSSSTLGEPRFNNRCNGLHGTLHALG